jgi:hypothetical protein
MIYSYHLCGRTPNKTDPVEADLVGGAVVEFGGSRRLVRKVTAKRFKGVTAKIAASDHCPVAIDLTVLTVV